MELEQLRIFCTVAACRSFTRDVYKRQAEMKTGEGKTLVAVLPAYLNALTGEGCLLYTSRCV